MAEERAVLAGGCFWGVQDLLKSLSRRTAAGVIHSARNVGTGRGRELARYIVEKGKPLLVLGK